MWGNEPDPSPTPSTYSSDSSAPTRHFNMKLTQTGVPIFLEPSEDVDLGQVTQDWNTVMQTWSNRDAQFSDTTIRYMQMPAWLRPPETPATFGDTSVCSQPFEVARVFRSRGKTEADRAAISSFIHNAPWTAYPYVEDVGAFCTSHTFNMASGVLFAVGPAGYRRFGSEQKQARKMYFSSPSAYRQWVETHYCN